MGGPAKGKGQDQGKGAKSDVGMKARQAFANGDYSTAYEELRDLPEAQTDPILKQVLALSKSYMGL